MYAWTFSSKSNKIISEIPRKSVTVVNNWMFSSEFTFPFLQFSGQFSLNSLSSLVTKRIVATLANAVCLTNYSYIFTHNVLEVTC